MKLYAPWGWIAGSGIYLDDVAAAVRAQALELGAFTLLVALLLWGASAIVLVSVRGQIRTLKDETRRLAEAVARGTLSARADPELVRVAPKPAKKKPAKTTTTPATTRTTTLPTQ